MFRRSRFAAVGVVVLATAILLTGVANGDVLADQAKVGGNALKVSPVRQSISMDPASTKTIQVTIENMTTTPANLHPVVNDFVAGSDEKGQPNIILNENEYAPSHSFKRFVTKIPDFTLGPRETRNISVKINVPADAAGGGYFGAVRFGAADPNDPNRQVSLSGSVGSLVLLRVNGNITEKIAIESFDVRQNGKPKAFFTTNKNLQAVVRFKNDGNVQVEPFGKFALKKSGQTLSTDEINVVQPRGAVLPDSIRRFEAQLTKVGPLGKYTIEGNFGYGTTGQLLTAKKTFYVIPVYIFILVGLVLIAILFAIFVVPRMVRNYNKRIIQRATKRRR
jgi:hypothetical protein